MKTFPILLSTALTTAALAQQIAIFPDEYIAVPEGPLNSPNLPLARGTSRVQCLYNHIDLAIPSGHMITKLGFRQDATLTTLDLGTTLQLEIRMGFSTFDHVTMGTNFDNNYAAPPVTVFGPAAFTLPNLRDAANPLPNGQFFINLTTPFQYVPAGRNLLVEYRVFGTTGGGAQFNYRLDRADYYSPVTTGVAGCPHSGGQTPTLALAPTRPGLSFTASVTHAPGSAPSFLAINLGNSLVTPYSLAPIFGTAPACMGNMSPVGLALLGPSTASTGGAVSWSFAIPNDEAFADYVISAQGLFLDFFSPGQLVSSNGAEVLTGARSRSTILAASGVPTVVTTGTKSTNYCPVAFFEHQ